MLLKTFGTYRILCKKFGRSRSLPKVRIFKNSAPKPKFGRTLMMTLKEPVLLLHSENMVALIKKITVSTMVSKVSRDSRRPQSCSWVVIIMQNCKQILTFSGATLQEITDVIRL